MKKNTKIYTRRGDEGKTSLVGGQLQCGRVGGRHFFKRSPEDAISSGLFCLLSVQQFFNVVEYVCFQKW